MFKILSSLAGRQHSLLCEQSKIFKQVLSNLNIFDDRLFRIATHTSPFSLFQILMKSKGMPRKPKKLCPWLVNVLDNKKYEHLNMRWEDRSEGLFWLPWPRQKKKGWNESLSKIFLDYVTMQNSYKDGAQKDFVTWKARFRTALHKDEHITEIKKKNKNGLKLYKIDLDFNRSASSDSSDLDSSEASSSVGSPSLSSTSSDSYSDEPSSTESEPESLPRELSYDGTDAELLFNTICPDEVFQELSLELGDYSLTDIPGVQIEQTVDYFPEIERSLYNNGQNLEIGSGFISPIVTQSELETMIESDYVDKPGSEE